jgi:hypothetical protein
MPRQKGSITTIFGLHHNTYYLGANTLSNLEEINEAKNHFVKFQIPIDGDIEIKYKTPLFILHI